MQVNRSITGDQFYLVDHLKESFKTAKKVDLIVSFLMESGVKLIQNELKQLKERGVLIRILTGNYMNITQPSALYLLKDILGTDADIRFYNDPHRSFHVKTYMFHNEIDSVLYIGSSNLSKSALTNGIEWNYKLERSLHTHDFDVFYETFESLFLNQSIIVDDIELDKYSKAWVKPKLSRIPLSTMSEEVAESQTSYAQLFEPRGAQIEALYHLKQTRAAGYDKGLVVAATGIGKTYLAAFDSLSYQRVLFIAHREEILKQAMRSFQTIHLHKTVGLFNGNEKQKDADLVFASVQTLSKRQNLEQFSPDQFDYIIVDEFHHAVAKQYQLLMNYFKPTFLLGLTATPQRLDNQDVLALCDFNLVYDAPLTKAINQRWLVPYRYYGIYDDTINYDEITIKNGKYDVSQLEVALSLHKRKALVFAHYRKYISKRALGFCVSLQHADEMARYFNERGIKSCSVHSGSLTDVSLPRDTAISKLKKGEISVIFSVDMFNEGLDIKEVDMVLFLRPTESPTVFLQQLGRGLRLSKDKHYLNVLDFIGNFKKVMLIPYLLSGVKPGSEKASRMLRGEANLPEDCFINFDFPLIDLVEKMERESMKLVDLIDAEYVRVKEELGYVPSRVELLTLMDSQVYDLMRAQAKVNIFKDYVSFLLRHDDVAVNDKSWVNSMAHDYIRMIENTSLSKMYKLPVLSAFVKSDHLSLVTTHDEIAQSFKMFYSKSTNAVDMYRDKATCEFKDWSDHDFIKLAKSTPIKYLAKTESKFIEAFEGRVTLTESLKPYVTHERFIAHIKDALAFREQEFYLRRLVDKMNT